MAVPDWPTALYGKILKDGFQEVLPDNTARTNMDMGPAKARRKSTSGVQPYNVQMFFSTAEVAAFNTFYRTTLNDGAYRFNFYAPRTKVAGEFRIPEAPTYTPMDQGYLVTFQMELLP